MVSHMKTTLNISEPVFRALKREAARQGKTMSELVETALRMLLEAKNPNRELPPLPVGRAGTPTVNLASREALYNIIEASPHVRR